MAKKIFVRSRLVKSAKWYIDFSRYDPSTGLETRHRKDFNLNDIEDLEHREIAARCLMQNLDQFAGGKPEKTNLPTLKDSVELAVAIKQRLPRESSRRKYITVSKTLLEWAKRLNYLDLPVVEFSRKYARAYWDEFTMGGKEYRGKTLNNYLDALRSLWNVMDERELVTENPWERIKPVREEEKLRRIFTDQERLIVANAALETDYWLFRGILLQFYCYIRPVELTRLKFKDFDFAKGTVTVREADAKAYRRIIKTIPRAVIHYFADGRFDKYPTNFFMFGRVKVDGQERMDPSTLAVDEMRPYKRHAKLLERLNAQGKLPGGIDGLTWYSWKDTGITLHARKTGPVSTKDQAGHRNLAMTSIYYHASEINPEYSQLDNDLLI